VIRAIAVASMTGLVLSSGSPPCWACECPLRTPRQILRDADAAFVGRVEGVVFLDSSHSIQTFEVEGVYEGVLGPTVSVHVQLAGDCPTIYYPQGERVGVVARLQTDGSYILAACDLVPLEDMERISGPARPPLEAGVTPGPPPTVASEAGSAMPFWAVAALGAAGALLIIAVAWGGGKAPAGRGGGAGGRRPPHGRGLEHGVDEEQPAG
jgi:hypothetical protein